MKVQPSSQVESRAVEMEGSRGCTIRILVGPTDGAPNFAMREFEIQPGGYTPHHHHPYEHEVFVIAGEGVVLEGNQEHSLKTGDVIFVKPDEVHQFRNTGTQPMKFLCLVPNSAATLPVAQRPECEVPASK
ncbi:MAG: cupin domain-containing protein [Pirellulales bacterium]|nr:cupin domain-containing protein [Pirellulales bacterium]